MMQFVSSKNKTLRADFDKNGISNLVTVGVRDIQGEGFPDEFQAKVDSIFLDLPQPWCVVPSAAKMLKQDGVMCSFSPCIEQVQCTCEALASQFTGNISSLKLCIISTMKSAYVSHYPRI